MAGYLFSDKRRRRTRRATLLFTSVIIITSLSALYALGIFTHLKEFWVRIEMTSTHPKDSRVLELETKISYLQSQLHEQKRIVKSPRWSTRFKSTVLSGVRIQDGQIKYLIKGCLDCVICNQTGLVGLSDNDSEMLLPITDPSMSLPVMVKDKSVQLLLQGKGHKNNMSVHELTGMGAARVGDILITSSIGGIYPSGIPVAKVVEKNQNFDGEWLIKARPLYWDSSLQYLFAIQSLS